MSKCANFTLALLGLIFLLPLFLIVALCIKIFMPGPVFFRQDRIGMDAKVFRIYKFRSMRVNQSKISITLQNDARITPLGKFLRKTKIDEIPQLINILKGDMAIVGPRPDVPGYADQLQGEDRIILSVKPGLTGLDSITYPDEETLLSKQENPEEYYDRVLYPAKVAINVSYVKSRSCWRDWKIIFRTVWVLVKSKSRRVEESKSLRV